MGTAHIEVHIAEDGVSPARIEIGGEVTLGSVSSLHAELLKAFRSSSCIDLDLGGITELDLAGLQLLCSAHLSACAQAVQLRVTGQSPLIREVAERSGHLGGKGCDSEVSSSCLWGSES